MGGNPLQHPAGYSPEREGVTPGWELWMNFRTVRMATRAQWPGREHVVDKKESLGWQSEQLVVRGSLQPIATLCPFLNARTFHGGPGVPEPRRGS